MTQSLNKASSPLKQIGQNKRDSLFDSLMLHHHSPECNCSLTQEESQPEGQKIRRLGIAFILIACFALSEWGMGWWTHSLALQAEAGHKISDSFALALSLITAWIGQARSSQKEVNNSLLLEPSEEERRSPVAKTQRLEGGAALINGIGLLAIAIEIAREATNNLQSSPTEILSLPLLITACVALVVDSINVFLLHDSSHHDLNVRAAFLHILVDVISSVGVLLAAVAVFIFDWVWADSAIGLFISGAIALSAIPLMRQSLKLIFLSTEC
jgi:cobalt-zinc-cadmium efflux system protein